MHKEIGKCYFCGEPVFASEGQAITWFIRKTKDGAERYPIHKKCKKLNK